MKKLVSRYRKGDIFLGMIADGSKDRLVYAGEYRPPKAQEKFEWRGTAVTAHLPHLLSPAEILVPLTNIQG